MPTLHRHFEAITPTKETPLSEPIPCTGVSVDLRGLEQSIRSMVGVNDVALRVHVDGSVEAFVFVSDSYRSMLDSNHIIEELANVFPGYSLPEPLHALAKPPCRTSDGLFDFLAIESEVRADTGTKMSPQALAVRDIMANILVKDSSTISNDSDFFLLGGNSLLLGRLAYFIRKETGYNVKIPDLFTHSTINDIVSLIESEKPSSSQSTLGDVIDETKLNDTSRSFDMHSVDYEDKCGGRSRGQTHPLSLLIQIIPLVRAAQRETGVP